MYTASLTVYFGVDSHAYSGERVRLLPKTWDVLYGKCYSKNESSVDFLPRVCRRYLSGFFFDCGIVIIATSTSVLLLCCRRLNVR